MLRRTRVTTAAVVGTLALGWGTAATAAPAEVLRLGLDEPRGATTAVDTSGRQHDGAIGAHVVMNGAVAAFDRHDPGAHADFDAAHLILVPDAPDRSLDPEAGNFSVEIRFRTKEKFGNVIQKGQATDPGGQVKFQIPAGKLSCMFKSPTGTATASSGTLLLNDNVFHTVRCDRTPTSVTMYVDGVRVGRKNGSTGTIDNTKPWSIGGKAACDGTKVTCDYFAGQIDYVTLTKG